MSTTCFVTGAGGFVGRALVNSLLAQGNHVRALDVRFPGDWPDDATRLRGDIRDRSLLEQGCRDAEFVFHCAALLPQRQAAAAVMRLTNVEGAGHLFNAALRARVSRVVMLSSTEVYGVPATVPCPEDAPQRPLGEYGRNKVEAEQLARDANDRGLQVVILRPTYACGNSGALGIDMQPVDFGARKTRCSCAQGDDELGEPLSVPLRSPFHLPIPRRRGFEEGSFATFGTVTF